MEMVNLYQTVPLMFVGDLLRLQYALSKVDARRLPLQLQQDRLRCRRAVHKTALEGVKPSDVVAVDVAQEACQRRVFYNVSKVIDWKRVSNAKGT